MSIDRKFRSQKVDRSNFLQEQNFAENRQNPIKTPKTLKIVFIQNQKQLMDII
jgi:hypothetical protein